MPKRIKTKQPKKAKKVVRKVGRKKKHPKKLLVNKQSG